MLKKIREYIYILKIRKAMTLKTPFSYITLNGYQSKAAEDLLGNRISSKFYRTIFVNASPAQHYTKTNFETIMNYNFFKN